MKTITTIFESILGQDNGIVWAPDNGSTEYAAQGWGWGTVEAQQGWGWGTIEAGKGWGWGT